MIQLTVPSLDVPYDHVIGSNAVERVQALLCAVPRSEINREDGPNRSSILDLAGLGKEIWQGTDAQRYIDELRDEWDT